MRTRLEVLNLKVLSKMVSSPSHALVKSVGGLSLFHKSACIYRFYSVCYMADKTLSLLSGSTQIFKSKNKKISPSLHKQLSVLPI